MWLTLKLHFRRTYWLVFIAKHQVKRTTLVIHINPLTIILILYIG